MCLKHEHSLMAEKAAHDPGRVSWVYSTDDQIDPKSTGRKRWMGGRLQNHQALNIKAHTNIYKQHILLVGFKGPWKCWESMGWGVWWSGRQEPLSLAALSSAIKQTKTQREKLMVMIPCKSPGFHLRHHIPPAPPPPPTTTRCDKGKEFS